MIRVAVLRGGPSDEYDISLQTGAGMLDALRDHPRYQALDVVITKQDDWIVNGMTRTAQEVLCGVDVALLALHGTNGEDGTIQRLLDRFGVKYTGSDAFASAMAMNKAITKDRLRDTEVLMPQHVLVTAENMQALQGTISYISELFGPQYVVKPIANGSSLGVQKVDSVIDLYSVLTKALEQYDQVLVEEYINGKEATCGVINRFRGADIYSLPPIEIVPPSGSRFFDYAVKYDGSTEEICPGRFSREEKVEMERVARHVHEVLGLRQYSRSDFMVTPAGIYFLEVNTLPGMTPASLMPKGLEAVGSSYAEFVDHLIQDALA